MARKIGIALATIGLAGIVLFGKSFYDASGKMADEMYRGKVERLTELERYSGVGYVASILTAYIGGALCLIRRKNETRKNSK